jgi:2-succinyl-5-enolpyruvyl-6-hydroxy-3-cyclohexene-1-carboxylate synthase
VTWARHVGRIVGPVHDADVQATFCATLVDEWVARGVRHAVVAPGSRSTPLALALAARPELAVHVVHDERVAAFVALGLGAGAATPPILLCTSGTAAANFLPAVVEAGLSAIGMVVVTADRPPELQGIGAAQTIEQTGLYGPAVRWSHDPGVPAASVAGTWRPLAVRALAAATAGPVHLNLPFREPLVGTAGPLPDRRTIEYGAGAPTAADGATVVAPGRRGIIVAGGRSGVAPADVAELADRTGWPVLADPLSGCRPLTQAVSAFDAILRHAPFAAAHWPDVVVRVGRPPASKVLTQWLVGSAAPVVQLGGPGVIDPDHNVVARVGDPAAVLAPMAADDDWGSAWCHAETVAERAIANTLAGQPALTEPGVARLVARHRPPGGTVVVASSMPVRDYEWYGGPTATGFANRGANGIDGVLSTALGLALAGQPAVAVVGDIAFAHDAGALTGLARRGADLRIVVVDNDGGGIFSFLPQATALPPERFEQLFGTPHGTDVVALARAHGIDAATVTTADDLVARLTTIGPSVTRVPTDRAVNVAVHAAIHATVAAALEG